MISRLDDLKAWGKEIATGSLLTPTTQAERLISRRFNGVPINLGYGLGCERINGFTGHNGAIYGFSTVVFHYPPADLTLAVVGNESTNSTAPTSTFPTSSSGSSIRTSGSERHSSADGVADRWPSGEATANCV